MIWDHLLVDGSVVLLKAGLIILEELKKHIMKAKEFRIIKNRKPFLLY